MKRLLFTGFLFLGIIVFIQTPVVGQPPLPDLVSPEVHPDKTVTFRLRLPDAEEVKIYTQFTEGEHALTGDTSGVWSVTLGPAEPDIYPYAFIVDGVRIMDPNNRLYFPNEHFKHSLVEIPADTPQVHSVQEVPHGVVSYRYYSSETLDTTRPLVIYTPPGYEQNPSKKYPVLYLIHGMTDTEETWFKVGRANFILDNLIARGEAEPMIIVMPYANTYSYDGTTADRGEVLQTALFTRDMVRSIIPFVEENYRTLPDKEHRAIAGFSLGGRHTLATGLSHPGLFDWVCAYAPAVWPEGFEADFENLYADPALLNELKLLSVSCGKEDGLYKSAQEFTKALEMRSIDYQTFFPSGGHTWMNCKKFLAESASKLFQE